MERVLLRYQGPPGQVPGWSPGETRAVDAATAAQLRAANPTWWASDDVEHRGGMGGTGSMNAALFRGASCR